MSHDERSRREFLKGAGLAAGGLFSGTPAAAAAPQGQAGGAAASKGARFLAALATG